MSDDIMVPVCIDGERVREILQGWTGHTVCAWVGCDTGLFVEGYLSVKATDADWLSFGIGDTAALSFAGGADHIPEADFTEDEWSACLDITLGDGSCISLMRAKGAGT